MDQKTNEQLIADRCNELNYIDLIFDNKLRIENEFKQLKKVFKKDLESQINTSYFNLPIDKRDGYLYWLYWEYKIGLELIGVAISEDWRSILKRIPKIEINKCHNCNKSIYATSRSDYHYKEYYLRNKIFKSYCKFCEKIKLQKSIKQWSKETNAQRQTIENYKSMPYKEYLQTEHWRNLRTTYLKRAKYKCQLCNSRDELHLHHRTYENIGNENYNDLIVLCSNCHYKFHSKLHVLQGATNE